MLGVGGYDNVQTIQHWLTEKENTKQEAYERMKFMAEEYAEELGNEFAQTNINYPRIIGPIDNISIKPIIKHLKNMKKKQKN